MAIGEMSTVPRQQNVDAMESSNGHVMYVGMHSRRQPALDQNFVRELVRSCAPMERGERSNDLHSPLRGVAVSFACLIDNEIGHVRDVSRSILAPPSSSDRMHAIRVDVSAGARSEVARYRRVEIKRGMFPCVAPMRFAHVIPRPFRALKTGDPCLDLDEVAVLSRLRHAKTLATVRVR